MINRWNLFTPTSTEKLKRNDLSKETDLHPILTLLLLRRGLTTKELIEQFFNPNLKDIHDPFLLPDMRKAINRINEALGKKEQIMIYGDYDVDGTTAVALVYKFLHTYTTNLFYYIPDRYDEGYGISFLSIDVAEKKNVKLIIALDCGIKAIDKVKYAKEKGIDFIICDHHTPDTTLPDAVAVVDAKRIDSIYPYKHLSGCGVGFKLMQAFAKSNGISKKELEDLFELTAISIAADIVPVTGENRILAYYGLKQINRSCSPGIKGVIDVCGLNGKEINNSDIIFKIGPRINASGRMENGKEAVELLLSNNYKQALILSENINRYNNERRQLDKKVTQEANEIINSIPNIEDSKAIVVYNENWHKGVIGIVASRLAERYYRPAVVLTKSKDMVSGSARSIMGFDIYSAIENCRDLLESFGGHMYASGLSLKENKLAAFRKKFIQIANKEIDAEQMIPQIDIDDELSLVDINTTFMNQLKKLEPFGPHNPKPVFMTRNVKDYGTSKLVGRDQHHIKLEIIDSTSNTPIHGIAFSMSKFYPYIKSGGKFNICYSLEENTYNGTTTLQLMVKDIKLEEM